MLAKEKHFTWDCIRSSRCHVTMLNADRICISSANRRVTVASSYATDPAALTPRLLDGSNKSIL